MKLNTSRVIEAQELTKMWGEYAGLPEDSPILINLYEDIYDNLSTNAGINREMHNIDDEIIVADGENNPRRDKLYDIKKKLQLYATNFKAVMHAEYCKNWYKTNKEKAIQYHHEYYYKNKDEILEKRKAKYKENPEYFRKYRIEYYNNNKEELLKMNKKWRRNNRETFTKIVHNRRKEVAKELSAKGLYYTYLPKTARENKNVEILSSRTGITPDEARNMLILNDWNCKMLIEQYKNEKGEE